MHRDLKPENIFFLKKSDLKTLKLGDFGLCASYGKSKEEKHFHEYCGTPIYMSREFAIG